MKCFTIAVIWVFKSSFLKNVSTSISNVEGKDKAQLSNDWDVNNHFLFKITQWIIDFISSSFSWLHHKCKIAKNNWNWQFLKQLNFIILLQGQFFNFWLIKKDVRQTNIVFLKGIYKKPGLPFTASVGLPCKTQQLNANIKL